MNGSLVFIYSFKKNTKSLSFDEVKPPFSNFILNFNRFIKGNDFSLTSLTILQFFFSPNIQDKIFLEAKKHLLKKEFFISIKESFFFFGFLKKFKNFSIWYHKYWISKKENFFESGKKEKNFYKKILIDPKNIHAWNFFFKSSIFLSFPLWKILIFLENLEYSDFINNSPWNYKIILLFRSKNLSQYLIKFLYKKNFYLFGLLPDIFWESLIKFQKIKNGRLLTFENYFKIRKKFKKKKD